MLKNTLLVLGIVLFSSTAQAQLKPMVEGNRSLAISVNPIFSFAGNLLSAAGNNDLRFNGAGAIYRKVYKPNRALRVSTFVNFLQSANQLQGSNIATYFRGSSTDTELDGSISIGKEYFKTSSSGQNHAWRWYGGWTVNAGVSYNRAKFSYEDVPGLVPNMYEEIRMSEREYGRSVNGGFSGIVGAEYYFSERFYIGVEASATLFIGYQFDDIERLQNGFYDQALERFIGTDIIEVESGAGVEFGLNNNLPIIFTAGFVF